jgi:hypothetical protein
MDFPDFTLIRQIFPPSKDVDLYPAVRRSLEESDLLRPVRGGQRVLITAGSRGINQIARALRAAVDAVRQRGGEPFIMPSMGSHGGGTGPGQVEMLAHLGVTEASAGAPINRKMKPREVGRTPELDAPVYADAAAVEADHILLINRIKEHTDYIGETESGLLKMAVVGLGRRLGAESMHRLAVNTGMQRSIHAMARVLFDRLPVLGGVALLEDHRNRPRRAEAVPVAEIFRREPELLAESKKFKPALPFSRLDLLMVDEIGKEISGTGMDTKVIGRIMNIYEKEPASPRITRIFLRSVTEKSAGNAIGMGMADFVHRRALERTNRAFTEINCITANAPEKARIPITLETDRQALAMALANVGVWRPETLRAAWISNTAELESLAVSTALAAEAEGQDDLEVRGKPFPLPFDPKGDLPWLRQVVEGKG